MSENKNGPADDIETGAELWRRAREGWHAAAGPVEEPEALTVAAYLEGRLDEAGAAAVETWMAAEPEALKSVLTARAVLAETPGAVPEDMVRRAQGAVRGRPRPGLAWLGALAEGLGGLGGLTRPAAWAGAAAALLLASVSGFELGRTGVEYMVSLDAAVAQDVRLVMGPSGQSLL